MTDAQRVRDLFDIPARVHQGDFVLKLTEGLQHPEQTVAEYVATPALVDAFDRALGLVGDALRTGQSKASYLHGSFGSGKSHFMAMLSLLLSGNESAWRLPEFHPLRQKHAFAGRDKLLELHFHMIGADSLEQKLFGTYLDHVQRSHPDATLPGLFADEELFDNARSTLARVGADTFFAEMGGKKGWGKHGAGLDQNRFDELSASSDPAERAILFSALVKTWFPSFTSQGTYIDLDTGLEVLARHAHGLGYRGVVFFLDELILWLAHRASERSWLNRETEKMIKLVEAQRSDRAIPIVSFVARQRSLDEMVGKMYTGQDEKLLNDLLNHAQGRFDTITLEDKNLPAIVEKRVLKPKNAGSTQALDAAFEELRRSAKKSWDTLLGKDDPDAFRKLYPFSPALVDALVALSNSLQRQRTAIKLLVELLAEHIEDLRVGEVVRVGDLYDVLAGGEEPADGVMLSRYRSAKQLYDHRFLPLLQESNAANSPDKCQRLRPGHPKRLGCSGCGVTQCRSDNRLVKTLLIAALVPEVPVLKELTVSRLSQLNHGSLKIAVPGGETAIVAGKLREWGAQNLPLQVGNEKDPIVSIRLEGVDLAPILKRYAQHDNPGNRQRVLRELLFDALGIDRVSDSGKDESVTWHKTTRRGRIVFGNVRSLGRENLRCPDGHDFRLVIDYPFDEPGKTPNDDVVAVEAFVEQESTWTLVWLPHFFSEAANRVLGDLVIIEHILSTRDIRAEAVSHLGVEDQARAQNDMDTQRSQKKNRLFEVMEQAYGLRTLTAKDIDPDHRVSDHLLLLERGARAVPPNLAANLASAKEAYVEALLERRYPNHPRFTHSLSSQRLERMLAKFGELLGHDGHRMPAERDLSAEMGGVLGAVGLVRVTEGYVHLVEDRMLQQIENKRISLGLERPTVDEVRQWIDPSGSMGLPFQAEDLIVRCYAAWGQRALEHGGRPFEPLLNRPLPGHATLEKPDMPEQTEWQQGVTKADSCLGLSLRGHYRSPDNLVKLHALLKERLEDTAKACAALPSLIAERAKIFGLDERCERATTARSADALFASLAGKSAAAQVRALAAFEPKTSATAVNRHQGAAKAIAELLENRLVFGVFTQLRGRTSDLPGAEELLEQAQQAFRQDEVHVALVERLEKLAERGQELLNPTPAPVESQSTVLAQGRRTAQGRAQIAEALQEVSTAVSGAAGEADIELALHWTLRRK